MTGGNGPAGGYVFDNAWQGARRRLALLEGLADPGTIRHLEGLGVAEGWRCLEVGAGGGSIAEWLCRRVGPAGHVLATDLDTRFLDTLQAPNLEVRRHDIATDGLPEAAFDLVHARALLTHLPARREALQHLVAALEPGGWLLVEEVDCVSAVPDPAIGPEAVALFEKGQRALDNVLAAGGADRFYGRRLYGDVCRAGLVRVEAEGRTTMLRGATPLAELQQLTVRQARQRLLDAGDLTPEEADAFIDLYGNPDFICMGNIIMAVWGQRDGDRAG